MNLDKMIFTKDDGTDLILTKDEAHKLYQELHGLFGVVSYPVVLPTVPAYPYRSHPWGRDTWYSTDTTLTATGGTGSVTC